MPGGNGFKESRVSVRKGGPALSPTGFLNMMMDKISHRHDKQLNPWFRGTVDSYNLDGTLNITRTGESVPDEQDYFVIGPPPPVGQDVYCMHINGGKPVVIGGFWTTVHCVRLWSSENPAFLFDQWVPMEFNTLVTDNGFGSQPAWQAAEPERLYLRAGGIWAFGGCNRWVGGSTAAIRALRINGVMAGVDTELVREQSQFDPTENGGGNLTQEVSTMMGGFLPGDHLRMDVYQGGTGPLAAVSQFQSAPVLWAYHIST